MDQRIEWLNEQINLMQQGRSIRPPSGKAFHQPDSEDITMLRIAARLCATGAEATGKMEPSPEFLQGLRARVLDSVVK